MSAPVSLKADETSAASHRTKRIAVLSARRRQLRLESTTSSPSCCTATTPARSKMKGSSYSTIGCGSARFLRFAPRAVAFGVAVQHVRFTDQRPISTISGLVGIFAHSRRAPILCRTSHHQLQFFERTVNIRFPFPTKQLQAASSCRLSLEKSVFFEPFTWQSQATTLVPANLQFQVVSLVFHAMAISLSQLNLKYAHHLQTKAYKWRSAPVVESGMVFDARLPGEIKPAQSHADQISVPVFCMPSA